MRKTLIAGAAIASLLTLGLGAPAQAANYSSGSTKVSVLHLIPNTPVDVYVNHKRLLNDFKPGTLAGPLTLKAGTYTVAIVAATATSEKNPVIGPVNLKFAAHRNYTVSAHLTADGKPTASLYLNSIKRTPAGDGRLIVRHNAAAPAVDVLVNGEAGMKGLTNPKQSKLDVPVGTYSAAVALAGTTKPVIGPANITIAKRTDTIVYAYGSAKAGNLNVFVQTVKTN